jgi:hypothetical protein
MSTQISQFIRSASLPAILVAASTIATARAANPPAPAPATPPSVGPNCHSSSPDQICLGLKYVVYKDGSGNPVESQQTAISNVQAINDVWKQCHVAFQIDQFQPVNPSDSKQSLDTANLSDLQPIRQDYASDNELVVVTTGKWDRSGSLGDTGANAWTAMPGDGPYGTVLESPVGDDSNVIAHELGHYLSLDHVNNEAQLMNPIIYNTSTQITDGECKAAQTTAHQFWSKMLR